MKTHAMLGSFGFSIETAMFQELNRTSAEKISGHSRVGRRDSVQHLGPGEELLTVPGYIMPGYAGAKSVDSVETLREMKKTGQSFLFIKLYNDGEIGTIEGRWMITNVDDQESAFFEAYAQRIDFIVSLKRVD